MHLLIASIAFGVVVTIIVPYLTQIFAPMIPASLQTTLGSLLPILVTGAAVVAVLYVAHKAGFGKYLSTGGA
jgi:hypothetical protein